MQHILFLFALLVTILSAPFSYAGFGGTALTGVQTNTLTASTVTAASLRISQVPTNNTNATVSNVLSLARPTEGKFLTAGVRKAPGVCPGANAISVFYRQNNTGYINMGCVAPSAAVLIQVVRYLEGGAHKVAYRGYPSTGGVFEAIVVSTIQTSQTVTCTGYHSVEWPAAPNPAPVYISTASRTCHDDNTPVLSLFGPAPGQQYGYQPGATKSDYHSDWTP